MLNRPSKYWPKTFKTLPKWGHFAKSGQICLWPVYLRDNGLTFKGTTKLQNMLLISKRWFNFDDLSILAINIECNPSTAVIRHFIQCQGNLTPWHRLDIKYILKRYHFEKAWQFPIERRNLIKYWQPLCPLVTFPKRLCAMSF